MCGSVPELHQVEHVDGRANKKETHGRAVDVPVVKHVEVASEKDNRVEELGFERDAAT